MQSQTIPSSLGSPGGTLFACLKLADSVWSPRRTPNEINFARLNRGVNSVLCCLAVSFGGLSESSHLTNPEAGVSESPSGQKFGEQTHKQLQPSQRGATRHLAHLGF